MIGTGFARVSRDYPVQLRVNDERAESRLWGLPIINMAVRTVALLPHMLWMTLLGTIGLLWLVLLGWLPILLTRRVPGLQAEIFEELIHRGSRMGGYVLLLPGYPPLGIAEPGPVDVRFDLESRSISRWWGIPLIGPCVRLIALTPHLLVGLLLGALVVLICALFVWIPILVSGRIPNAAARFFGAYLRYSARLAAYASLLPVPYPPFSLR
jgi:hypothetical protein